MNEYQEFPKWLHHPASQPAVISAAGKYGQSDAPPGSPMTFPPVMVYNSDDEAYYVSRGYNASTSSRQAYERQMVAPPPAGLKQLDYPMYGADGKIIQDPNAPLPDTGEYPKWVGDEIAHNQVEEYVILARRPELAAKVPASHLVSSQVSADLAAEWQEFLAWKAWKAAQSRKADVVPSPQEPKPANRRKSPLAAKAPKKQKRVITEEHKVKLRAALERARESRRAKKQGLSEGQDGNGGIRGGEAPQWQQKGSDREESQTSDSNRAIGSSPQ